MTRAAKVTLCKRCGKAPVAANHSRGAKAYRAGQCSACFRKDAGLGVSPAKGAKGVKVTRLDLGGAIAGLDSSLRDLEGVAAGLARDTNALLARSRAFVDGLGSRLASLLTALHATEKRLREANAEARRQTVRARKLGVDVARTIHKLPDHLDTEGSRAGKAAEEAREPPDVHH